MTPMFLKTASVAALLSASGLAALPAYAQSVSADTNAAATSAQFARFTPSQSPRAHRIDYSIWDDALANLVISMGPSLRKTAALRQPSLGTRRIAGHQSRYRLEGSRVMFSFLEPDVKATFTEYRLDLERTADTLDIQNLPRNEQLAFWMNLHNVAMIEQIALAWPVRQPRQITIGDVTLDEAKFITVQGVAMSPKDIRTQIVYPNWKDPRVIYGFWRGDIGGPAIQRKAFNGENLAELLDKAATELVNSLRGTQKRGDALLVSSIFEEAAPFYFKDFSPAIRAHITKFAEPELLEIMAKTSTARASITEYDIADLAGGAREINLAQVESNGRANGFRIPPSMARLLAERERKYDLLIRRGRRGTVTFSDIELPGQEPKKKEID